MTRGKSVEWLKKLNEFNSFDKNDAKAVKFQVSRQKTTWKVQNALKS